MNEILYNLGWVLRGIELFILIFILVQFRQHRWKLFFGVRKDLPTIQHHELHSCFISALCVLIFHWLNSEIAAYILSFEMEKVEKIKLFYVSKSIVLFSFIATLFCLHLIRGCTFSRTARNCTYIALIFMLLQGIQLIARGYLDYHGLINAYVIATWICNFAIVGTVAVYPIREFKNYIKQKRATE